eukprot:s414_g25.t3
MGSSVMKIQVQRLNGEDVVFEVNPEATVRDFKSQLRDRWPGHAEIHVILGEKELEDETETLQGAGLCPEVAVQVLFTGTTKPAREAATTHVTLRMGDAREHLELFNETHLVFWNNLCFASETSSLITKAFAERAAKGARLVTLAELEVNGLTSLTMRRGEVLVEVDWREEGYLPYVYIRH